MKLILTAAAALWLMPAAAFAQNAPAPATAAAPAATPAPAAAPAATAKFNLDTPIEALAADEKAKAVLMADLPDLLPHPSYEQFKGMSLRQVQPYSQGALTDELLAKVEGDLAAIK
jgi:hypothetical protein